jgi:hypothetical protein
MEFYGASNSDEKDQAEFFWTGKVFVSHTTKDSAWCQHNIVRPINRQFGQDTCFFLNKESGDRMLQNHFQVIIHSFKFTKTVIVTISENSQQSVWMPFETQWAVEQSHPIVLCLKDNTDPSFLRQEFAEFWRPSSPLPIALIDFREDAARASVDLVSMVGIPEFKPEPLYSDDFLMGATLWPQYREWRARTKGV